MLTEVPDEHKKNTQVLRAFYRRPVVKQIVRHFQKVFDEGYWRREQVITRKAQSLDLKLSLACRQIFRKSGIQGVSVQYPRVSTSFENHALLAIRQLLGIPRDDQRITTTLSWFKWLVRNWNVERDDVPKLPKEILNLEPQLSSYAICAMPAPQLPREQKVDRPWHLNSWVSAQVFPGASHRDLQKCMRQVYSQVNAQSNGKGVRLSKGGAPARLADWEWEAAFSQFGPMVNGISPRLRKIQEYIENQYGEHYSASQIRSRYEEFLSTRPEFLNVR